MDLKEIAVDVVNRAMRGGASAAESVVREGNEFSTVVRLGQVETLKESGSKAIGVRVFRGQRAASTYSSDLSPEGLDQMVTSALALAEVTSEDPHAGLPEPGQLGSIGGDLDLFLPFPSSPPVDGRSPRACRLPHRDGTPSRCRRQDIGRLPASPAPP